MCRVICVDLFHPAILVCQTFLNVEPVDSSLRSDIFLQFRVQALYSRWCKMTAKIFIAWECGFNKYNDFWILSPYVCYQLLEVLVRLIDSDIKIVRAKLEKEIFDALLASDEVPEMYTFPFGIQAVLVVQRKIRMRRISIMNHELRMSEIIFRLLAKILFPFYLDRVANESAMS